MCDSGGHLQCQLHIAAQLFAAEQLMNASWSLPGPNMSKPGKTSTENKSSWEVSRRTKRCKRSKRNKRNKRNQSPRIQKDSKRRMDVHAVHGSLANKPEWHTENLEDVKGCVQSRPVILNVTACQSFAHVLLNQVELRERHPAALSLHCVVPKLRKLNSYVLSLNIVFQLLNS